MAEPWPNRPLTVDEYLRLENASPLRHEYFAGEVYEMSGVTRRHARLVKNIARRVSNVVDDGPCDVMIVDFKLRVGDRFYYPDVMVVCTPGDDDDLVIRDPCFVVEVTSPSTARVDRGEKRDTYLTIPSLLSYFVVDHRRRHVAWDARDASGTWQRGVATEGVLNVPCPAMTLSVDQIYAGVRAMTVEEQAAEYAALHGEFAANR